MNLDDKNGHEIDSKSESEIDVEIESEIDFDSMPCWAEDLKLLNIDSLTKDINEIDQEIDFEVGPFDPLSPCHDLNCRVKLWRGDITRIRCDAIQNAARPSLLGGGGIDRRIHQVAGPELKQYCATLPLIREKIRCRNGQTKISPAFGNLKCKFVLHSVGPHRDLHKEEEGDQLLIQAYNEAFEKAKQHSADKIALCCLSTGAYRWDSRRACNLALACIRKALEKDPQLQILICTYTKGDLQHYQERMRNVYFRPCD